MNKNLGIFQTIKNYASNYVYGIKNLKYFTSVNDLEEPKILFFMPEAAVESYLDTHKMIAEMLKKLGFSVLFVRCFALFERCNVMDMFQLDTFSQKRSVCINCTKSFDRSVKKDNLDFIDLRIFEDKSDIKEINSYIDQMKGELIDFQVEGIPFGKIAFYNFSLAQKKSNPDDLTENLKILWLQYIRTCMLAYRMVGRLLNQFNITHVISFSEYSMDMAISLLAKQRGIQHQYISYPIHRGIDKKFAMFSNDSTKINIQTIFDRWLEIRNLAIPAKYVEEGMEDLIYKITKPGSHNYSPKKTNKNILQELNIPLDKKIIVVYTSSEDEVNSSKMAAAALNIPLREKNDAFSSQIEWINILLDYAKNNKDCFFIIRLHPRLGITHKEKIAAPALLLYKENFSKDFDNAKIIWPEEQYSSYDFAEMAHCVLFAWSTMGSELSRMGLTALTGLREFVPIVNDEFCITATSKEEYLLQLDELIYGDKSLCTMQKLKLAFRWYYFYYLGYGLDTSEDHAPEKIKAAVLDKKDVLDININNIRKLQNESYSQAEESALKKSIMKLINLLVTGLDNKQDILIRHSQKIDSVEAELFSQSVKQTTLFIDDNNSYIYYDANGVEQIKKYSPMVVRLAKQFL